MTRKQQARRSERLSRIATDLRDLANDADGDGFPNIASKLEQASSLIDSAADFYDEASKLVVP